MTSRRGKCGNSDRFYFLGLQNQCGWWLHLWKWKTLAPWKESYGKSRQCTKKQRHYFADTEPCSQSYSFSSSHVQCETWTIKKADAFILWSWRRLLRAPWTAKRTNQPIIKEISLEYSLEELMLKLQQFDHLMLRGDSMEKTLKLGKIEGGRRSGQQRMRWLYGITTQQN